MAKFKRQTSSAMDLATLLGEWRTTGGTLSISLATALAHLIESGRLLNGDRLPPQRVLASSLDVNRGTVTTAYEILAGRGYVTAEVGRGSTINAVNKRNLRPGSNRAEQGVTDSAIDLSTQSLPATTELVSALDRVTENALRPYLETDGHYPLGLPVLRSAVARHLTTSGVETTADQILITNGAQQAVWLATFALVGRDDTVLVEDPTYRGTLAALETARPTVRVVGYSPFDDASPISSRLHASALYCQSSVHSPTGIVTSPDRATDLAHYAEKQGAYVIDDRSAADLVYDDRTRPPDLSGYVDPARLVTIGTTSKLFWGGLRIGWIRSDPRVISAVADVKQSVDITTSVVDQFLAVEVLAHAESAAAERRRLLLEHLDQTTSVLRDIRPNWTWTDPLGGSGIWIDTGTDAIEFAMKAQARGIRVADGPSFSIGHRFDTHIRLPLWRSPRTLRHALESLG